MMYEAEINYHNMRQIECEPHYLGTISGDDLRVMLFKAASVCVEFDQKRGLSGFSLTIDIRELK